jgi:hypothetical protein
LQCIPSISRASLQKADASLPDGEFEELLQQVEVSSRRDLQPLAQELRYERDKRGLLAARTNGDGETARRLSARLEPQLRARQDADLAGLLAWDALDRHDYPLAENWFRYALQQRPGVEDWTFGLALAVKQSHGPQAAASVLGETPKTPRLRQLLGDLRVEQGWALLEQNRLDEAENQLKQAWPLLENRRDGENLSAWIDLRQSRHARAAAKFLQLYGQEPTPKLAEALVLSYGKLSPGDLHDLPEAHTEPLRSAIREYDARSLFDRKQFLASRELSGKAAAELQNVETARIDAGVITRHRSGQGGMGRLTIVEGPQGEYSWSPGGSDRISFRAAGLDLESGKLAPCAQFGARATGCAAWPGGATHLHGAAQLELSWSREGWINPYFRLGATPIGGAVAPLPTFRLGLNHQEAWGRWQVESFSQPVRESLLSYAGVQDPVSGKSWGRVTRIGAKSSAYVQLSENWGGNAEVNAAYLGGQGVQDNWTTGLSLATGYDLRLPGFDYFSLGPAFNYQHYQSNLNHFTLGNGGYFSPDRLINAGLGLNFLTAENQRAVLKGRVGVGYQHFYAPSQAWFPLALPPGQSRGSYSASHYDGIAFDLELKGVWLIDPHWMLAGGVAARQTSGYEDYSIGLNLRFNFDGRQSALSADIPDGLFQMVY